MIKRRTLRARPRVHARELIDLLRDRQKGCQSAAPADGIVAAHCGRAEIRRFRLKGSLRQDITPREKRKRKKRIAIA
jgi:hypothetical protein